MSLSISKSRLIVLLVLTISVVLTIFVTNSSKEAHELKRSEACQIVTPVISPYEKAMDEYKAIIEKLPEGSAYAFADMSKDHDVLLVTDSPISFHGKLEAAKAKVYGYDKNGHIKNYGTIKSTSTSMPIVVRNHHAFYGSHHVMNKATVDEQKSKLIVKTAKEGDKNYDAFFNDYAKGTVVKFTSDKAARAESEKVTKKAARKATQNLTVKATAKKAAKAGNQKIYKSADGWQVRYNTKTMSATKISNHHALFAYEGEPAASIEIKYIANKQPEEVLYDVTSKWGDQSKIYRYEDYMPGTKDKWAFYREASSSSKAAHFDMNALAGEYNGGTLLIVYNYHTSGVKKTDETMVDTLGAVIDSITYTNYKDQKMFSYHPGTYKANKGNKAFKSVVLNKNHTGVLTDAKGRKTQIVWGSTELMEYQSGKTHQYTIEGTSLSIEMNGHWVEFSK